jgi:hypothetical protein
MAEGGRKTMDWHFIVAKENLPGWKKTWKVIHMEKEHQQRRAQIFSIRGNDLL